MSRIVLPINRRRSQFQKRTPTEASEVINFPETALRNIVSGLLKLDIKRMNDVAEILDISLSDLISFQQGFDTHQTDESADGLMSENY